jgi:endoglucanase
VSGYGYSNTASPTAVGPDAADVALIKSWHLNTVRVPLNQDCWQGADGQPSFGDAAGYQAAVKDWVTQLTSAGLAVIVDLHWSAPDGLVAQGQRAMSDDRSPDFWTSVAATFKDNPAVMFDAFNEPYSRYNDDGSLAFDLTWQCWRDGGCNAPWANDESPLDGNTFTTTGMAQLVAAIRAAGATQPIMLGGRDYANDLSQWLDFRPDDSQLVASFHNYNGQACEAQSCWDRAIAPLAAQVPVVTGEIGDTDCKSDHIASYMDWADQHAVGYLVWAWWVLPDEPECAKLAVLADVKGTPRAPNGTALKAHLDKIAGVALKASLGGKSKQKLGSSVAVTVKCSAACRATARGTLVVGRKSYKLRAVKASVTNSRTLKLKLSKKQRAAAAKRGSAIVKVSLSVVDAAGGKATARRTIKLTR